MSLVAATVVTTALLGGVQFHADAQGDAVLAWGESQRRSEQIRAVDVRDGRPQGALQRLVRGTSVELADADVSPGGAAVVCFRDRADGDGETWRLRIVRRAPGQAWSKPILVADPHEWIDRVSCAIADSGQVAVAWTAWRKTPRSDISATTVRPDGSVEPPTVLAEDAIDDPETVIAPDGAATVAFTLGSEQRNLYLSQRPPAGGWTTRSVAPASGPLVAIDGTGRMTVAFAPWNEVATQLWLASGPAFTPTALTYEPESGLLDLAAGPRGDLLAVWVNHTHYLKVSLQRPGQAMADPVAIGRIGDFPAQAVLAGDGTGAVAWSTRKGIFTRKLSADGHWGPPIHAGGLLTAGPGGRVMAASVTERKGRQTLRVRELG